MRPGGSRNRVATRLRRARRVAPVRPVSVDIVVQSPRWRRERRAKNVIGQAIEQAALATSAVGELAVVLTDDAAIRRLNRSWRGEDRATNVLSFPTRNGPGGPGSLDLLGDIVIAYETVQREACSERKPFAHHLAHLAVHGFLHLLGYDHQRNEHAEIMEALEAAILARLGVPDPRRSGR